MFEDFFKAVEVTWQNPSFAHLGGESSAIAQKRGIDVVHRLLEQQPTEQIVLTTHGNLMGLILQTFDPSVDFIFWCQCPCRIFINSISANLQENNAKIMARGRCMIAVKMLRDEFTPQSLSSS